jgi:hypothetical protein
MAKIGRNQPCPCGSGKKYKRCHGAYGGVPSPLPNPTPSFAAGLQNAAEHIRQQQQGKGRPIIAFKNADQQIVAVGNTVHWSNKWKTFPDFLIDYMKGKLGIAWTEVAKPLADQHPLMQWAHHYVEYQKSTIKNPGEVTSAEMTGVVACFLGTAYALYLLDHNVELQERLLNRLKDVGNFQGAYYELFVASTLIRAGFTLTLEDETDMTKKHCEFAAVSQKTGTKYWVEAKMRSVAGMLGRSGADGGPDAKPLARMIPHLNDALAKPATDDRLIFIDLNTPPRVDKNGQPDWLEPATRRLEQYEKSENKTGATAFVFLTNVAYHRDLSGPPSMAASPFGLGLPDFNRPGMVRVTEAYRRKQKYTDAHAIGNSIENCLRFPVTFDGKLPSEAFGHATSRVKIGETYFFPDVGEKGMTGVVSAATVDEQNKVLIIGVSSDTETVLLRSPMSDNDFAEWKEYGDASFGRVPLETKSHVEDEFELFEWFMETHKDLTRDQLISRCAGSNLDFEKLSDEELRMAYCEAMVAALPKEKKPAGASEG